MSPCLLGTAGFLGLSWLHAPCGIPGIFHESPQSSPRCLSLGWNQHRNHKIQSATGSLWPTEEVWEPLLFALAASP